MYLALLVIAESHIDCFSSATVSSWEVQVFFLVANVESKHNRTIIKKMLFLIHTLEQKVAVVHMVLDVNHHKTTSESRFFQE